MHSLSQKKKTANRACILQFFFSRKKKQREQLSIWVQEQRENLGSNHLDEEFLQTEQCLDEVTNVKIVIL